MMQKNVYALASKKKCYLLPDNALTYEKKNEKKIVEK